MPTAFIHHAGSGTGHSSGYGIGGGAGGGKVQQQRAGRTLLASWLGRLQAGVGSCLPGASQRGAGAGRVD